MKILVFNAGSSSQKSNLYELEELPNQPPQALWEAKADWGEHVGKTQVKITTSRGQTQEEEINTDSRPEVIQRLLKSLVEGKVAVLQRLDEIDVVGHRVVHGGQEFRESVVVTPAVKEAIQRLAEFAPLHNPANLEGIEAVERALPNVPQVAVFDTSFHSDLPLAAALYPGPYEWFERGIRRYGFHGINYQYCAPRAAQLLGKELEHLRLVICHIGNGCSLAAIRGGRSVETTMGFTPLEGLMMGSRSGSVDPSILIYLLRADESAMGTIHRPLHTMKRADESAHVGYSADQLETILNTQSGLKGVSGVSSDMREIHAAMDKGNERAKLAFDVYVHRLRYYIGAMLATLGGMDALVFTGGVGEHDAQLRAAVCENFAFLGLKLDAEKNERSPVDEDIAVMDAAVRVLVIAAQEDWSIAKECWRLSRT